MNRLNRRASGWPAGHRPLASGVGWALGGLIAMARVLPGGAASGDRLQAGDPLPRIEGSFVTGRSVLILVDSQGVVRWVSHGPFDAPTAKTLEGVLATLPAASEQ
jgi:hypothetical protein